MDIKQKIKELNYYKILRHSSIAIVFLFIFCVILSKINILPSYWNLTYMFYFTILIVTLFFELKIKKIHEKEREKSGMIYIFSYLFLLTLIIFATNHFLNRQIILDYMPNLIALSISFGFLTFYSYRNRVEKEIEQEKIDEEKSEKKRAKDFYNKFPKINKIPILRNIVKWGYKEGFLVILFLILILVIFTAIKYPYFGVSFTGEHTMKYNTYVEPAKYMVEHNNPFWYQKKYLIDPIWNKEGIFNYLGTLPIMEWGLFLTYKLLTKTTLEFSTRMFTNFIGILILIHAFIFFRFWFSRIHSLIIIFLMAINPIISFVTFVTVEDSFLILFMFLSLIYLNKSLNSQYIKNLYLSGLLFGIGNSIKYSLFLWLAPIAILILFVKKRDYPEFIKNSSIYLFLSILPILTVKTSIKYLPSNPTKGILFFIAWIILYFLIYKIIKSYKDELYSFSKNLYKHKIILLIVLAVSIILGFIFLKYTNLISLSNEFLTDSKLIFNYPMYKYMLLEQFKVYMTPTIFGVGLIGLFSLLFLKNKKIKLISVSFLIGSLIYWILASKVIFFHNYYSIIIMISFCILVSNIVLIISKINKKRIFSFIIIILFVTIIYSSCYTTNIERLKREKNGFIEAADYLRKNTNIIDLYIDEGSVLSLTIKTDRGKINEISCLYTIEFKEYVRDIGFAEAMKKYNIKYLITTNKEPKYTDYANIFTDIELQSTSYRRSDIINDKLFEYYDYFSDQKLREKIINDYNVKDKFILEKQIGDYRFFTFKD